ATRTEIYSTCQDGQPTARIRIYQGAEDDTRFNEMECEFLIQVLAHVAYTSAILVRLDLDLTGILRVTATERATGLAKQVVIDNAMERFRQRSRIDARDRLDSLLPAQASRTPGETSLLTSPPEKFLDPALRAALD